MKKFLFTAAALLLSTAAAAQMPPPGPGWNGGPPPPGARLGWDGNAFWRGAPDSPHERMAFLRTRLRQGVANGSIDRYEADRVYGELNHLEGWIHRMHWEDQGGLTPDQRGQVQAKLDQISQQIHWMRHDGW